MDWNKEKFDWPHHNLSNFIDSKLILGTYKILTNLKPRKKFHSSIYSWSWCINP